MITSKSNDLVKHIKLLMQKKERDLTNEYIVEGKKMVQEAIEMNVNISCIVVCEELFSESIDFSNHEVIYVSAQVFEFIADTKTPQGILAIVKKEDKKQEYSNVIFALDAVQDPGNLGTIIRTLDCAGINTLLLSKKCADVYNPKVIRSTMGAIYRVNVFSDVDLYDELNSLKSSGYEIIVSTLDGAESLFDYSFKGKFVVVIGNESNGVSKEIRDIADKRVKIPMNGKTESLNAGVAASIIAYEVFRKME